MTLDLPTVGGDDNAWGEKNNACLTDLDDRVESNLAAAAVSHPETDSTNAAVRVTPSAGNDVGIFTLAGANPFFTVSEDGTELTVTKTGLYALTCEGTPTPVDGLKYVTAYIALTDSGNTAGVELNTIATGATTNNTPSVVQVAAGSVWAFQQINPDNATVDELPFIYKIVPLVTWG